MVFWIVLSSLKFALVGKMWVTSKSPYLNYRENIGDC